MLFRSSGLNRPSGRPPLFELLKFRWCEVAEVRMKSLAIIVEDFHVFEYLRPGVLLASVDLAPNQLCSQGLEECFRPRVIPAVALAAHALNETVPVGNRFELTACVLNSAIGMKHQSPLADGDESRPWLPRPAPARRSSRSSVPSPRPDGSTGPARYTDASTLRRWQRR